MHAPESANLALEILNGLRFSNEKINKVTSLIANHIFDYKHHMSGKALRHFIKRVGKENVNDFIKLREADDFAHGRGNDFEKELKAFKKQIDAINKEPPIFSIHDLAVDGYDIMK